MALFRKIKENPGQPKRTILSSYGVLTGIGERTIRSYYDQLEGAGMIEEKEEAGLIFVAVPDYWKDNGKESSNGN